MKRLIFILFLVPFLSAFPQKKNLTLQQGLFFGTPRLTKQIPQFVKWNESGAVLVEGRKYYLADNQFGVNDYFDYGELTSELPSEYKSAQIATTGKDLFHYVLKIRGDLYYFSAEDNIYKRLTALKGEEHNPEFSPDYSKVAFTNNHNLYVVDVASGLLQQVTSDGSETIKNGYASWVYYEEILGRSSHYRSFYWSNDSKKIAFLRFDDSSVPKFPLFNAEGVHGKLEWEYYPKAGDPDPKVWLEVADVETGSISVIDSSLNSEKYIAWIFWTPNNNLFYETINREQDSLRFYIYDFKKGEKKIVYTEHQSSWVEFIEDVRFTKNGFYFISNYEGIGKVYYYNYDGERISKFGNKKINLTKIKRVTDDGTLFCEGFPLGSVNNYLYKIDGNKIEKITKREGYHSTHVSPNGNFVLDYFSNLETPQKLIAIDLTSGKDSVLFDSKTEAFDNYYHDAKLFYYQTRDGLKLPAIKFLPPDFDKTKKYPVLFSIYGGPGYALVKNRFPFWLKPFYYAQQGMIVIIADNRAAGHYGKKVISQIHRKLGKYDVDDFIDLAEHLKKEPYVDSTRIGITGGSYGGYVTLLALTRGSNTFTHGLAEFAVTDWHLYDNVYTERYMDKPSENPDGYEYGSVLTYANRLKGKLMITAGNMDDNVHYQNTLQLVDKFENLGKKFEMKIYTNERHGYRGKWFYAEKENLDFWMRNFNLK